MTSSAPKALFAVLAVAGYQNRDKIAEMLRGLRSRSQPGPDGNPRHGELGGVLGGPGGLDGRGGLFSGGAGGGSLSAGRSDLFKQFQEGPR
jgi:uncharacterized protein YidB (DUF937 family)